MKKYYVLILLSIFTCIGLKAQVTGIYTDYQGYWSSFQGNINSVKPINSHNLLGFEYNGNTYSTGVNDAILTNQGVGFIAENYRALPLAELANINSSSAYIGLGQIYDGIDNGVDNGNQNPFPAITDGSEAAYFLTDGPRGLDLGTGIANIDPGTTSTFQLSSNGITQSKIGDGTPDIVISNIATPSGNNIDKIKFVDGSGNTVGNEITIQMNTSANPPLASWTADYYNFNSTQTNSGLHNTSRNIRFFAAELSTMGITNTNYQNAAAIVYTSGGTSDPAFLAYNEEAISVASKLEILSSASNADCNGVLNSNISLELQDFNGFAIQQSGYSVSASIYTGAGALLGTTTKQTDSNGQVVFDDLSFEVGGDHKIIFESTSLKPAITTTITGPNCTSAVWTGNIDTDWDNPGNWSNNEVPNANFDVIIPTGATNYPQLNSNTGAKNFTLQIGSSLDLNGFLFNISGDISFNPNGGAQIFGDAPGSTLYFTGIATQTIQNNLIANGELANLTLENSFGLDVLQALKISEVLQIKEGTLSTNDQITLTCDFATLTMGQVAPVTGVVSGKITTEQCFPARRAFRMVSSPVTTTTSINANWQEGSNNTGTTDSDFQNPNNGYGTHITGSTSGNNGLDATPSGNPSLFQFDNPTQNWTAITNTLANTLTAGEPYLLMVRGSRAINVTSNAATPTNTKIRAKGTIVQGDKAFTSNFSVTQGDFNAFGNPYAAAIDMRKVLNDANTKNAGRHFYIYDPTLGGNPTVGEPGGRGAYVIIDVDDLSTEILPNGTGGTSEANRFLQPMQAAFFVTANQNIQPAIQFKESYKNVNQAGTAVFRSETTNTTSIAKNIQLYLFTEEAFDNGYSYSDRLKINFSSNFDNAITYKDAPKLSNLDENLSRAENGILLGMEKRFLPTEGEVLALDINQYRNENYVLHINVSNLDIPVYLEDNYLESTTLLNAGGNSISFQVDGNALSTATDRFSLRFTNNDLATDNLEKTIRSYYPNPIKNNQLFIELGRQADTNYSVKIYNVLGQTVLAKTLESQNGKLQVNGIDFPSGIYYLVLHNTTTKTQETIKIIKP